MPCGSWHLPVVGFRPILHLAVCGLIDVGWLPVRDGTSCSESSVVCFLGCVWSRISSEAHFSAPARACGSSWWARALFDVFDQTPYKSTVEPSALFLDRVTGLLLVWNEVRCVFTCVVVRLDNWQGVAPARLWSPPCFSSVSRVRPERARLCDGSLCFNVF